MKKASFAMLALSAAVAGCGPAASERQETDSSPVAVSSSPLNAKPNPATDRAGIHNLMKVSERIYSGSEPHGEEGFASLAKLGVATVVSVDGARPNVELARKHRLRYVHIPIGYDGVPTEAGQSLARLMLEAKAPFYVHCHHGKHRGPAAAAVACIASGDAGNEEALQVLVRAGTGKDYPGLWRDVENYTPPPESAELPELVEVAEVGSFAAAMAQVDRSYDNLKLCRDAGWAEPPNHPDLMPPQEALLLQEGLHEAARNVGDEYDEQFKTWLIVAEALATSLRSDLEAKNVQSAGDRFALIEQSCKQCHQSYRDQ